MISKKTTITVGIPAFNEEKNIVELLDSIEKQNRSAFSVEKILVISDGSSDNTVKSAKKNHIQKLEVIEFPKRSGKNKALEFIQKQTTTDILVLFDADVQIRDTHFIEKLIDPIINNKSNLTSASVIPIKNNTFFGKILYFSNRFKLNLYESWNMGNNLYTCHGRALAMDKKMYSKMNYENIIADDALAFLTAKKNNLKYSYSKNAQVFYRIPKTINDHTKQSTRFMNSQKQLYKYFDAKIIDSSYKIPMVLAVKTTFSYFMKEPISMIMYVFIFTYLKILTSMKNNELTVWETARTSK